LNFLDGIFVVVVVVVVVCGVFLLTVEVVVGCVCEFEPCTSCQELKCPGLERNTSVWQHYMCASLTSTPKHLLAVLWCQSEISPSKMKFLVNY